MYSQIYLRRKISGAAVLCTPIQKEKGVTEEDIKEVTVSNVLVDDIYNDVGFMVGSTLLVLVECQATWTVNIIFRALMYLVQTYREYFKENKTEPV